jgi:hypothetical protein
VLRDPQHSGFGFSLYIQVLLCVPFSHDPILEWPTKPHIRKGDSRNLTLESAMK